MEKRTEKLSNKTILGYGLASIGDAAPYNFIAMYLIYYLTTVVGMNPVTAGLIYSTATIIQGIVGVFLGPITDNTKNRFGRRRPFILVGGILIFVTLILLFIPVNFGKTGNVIYYGACLIIYMNAYSLFMTAYTALSSEMTMDYDERTKLRTPATIFQSVGNIMGMSLPMACIAFMVGSGKSESQAWSIFVTVLSLICFVGILVSWKSTKGKELPAEVVFTGEKEENPIKTYLQMFTLKPFIVLMISATIFYIGYMVFQSGLTFYVLSCTGLAEAQMTTALLITNFVTIALALIISRLANMTDKRTAMIICFLISAIGMGVFYIIGVRSLAVLVIMLFLYSFGNGAYWLLCYPLLYDVAEVYDYKYGKRKEGTIFSLTGLLIGVIGVPLGTQVLTIALNAVGYDASLAVQSAATSNGVALVVLGIPALCFIIGALSYVFYPITKKKYEILMEQKEVKHSGETPDESQLKRIV